MRACAHPSTMDISQVWHEATERVKDRVIHPTLWRALETAVPITVEDELFVVGFAPGTMHLSGHLTSADHRNAIENAIAGSAGKKLRLCVIDGATLDDWNHFKARQTATREVRQKQHERARREMQTTQTWDSTLEKVGRSYAALNLRQLPQVRGKYLLDAIEMISTAMDELYNDEAPDEVTQRALARVIDRVGTLTEVPAALIALELLRYRQTRG